MIDVSLLGTGGMIPLPGRFLSSLLLRVDGSLVLVDCGEGTQVSMRILGWGFKNIDIICFTHYHGDHISGLPGLLLTLANSDRTEPLTLIGPTGLKSVVNSLLVIASDLPFRLVFLEWDKYGELEYTDGMFAIKALPVRHRTPCFAYSFELKRRGKFDPLRAKELNIPVKLWGILQKLDRETYVYNGMEYKPDMVLGSKRKGIKIVYCTDTRPIEALHEFASYADLFVCEGLYGSFENQKKTAAHMHMSFMEAADIAKKAQVKEMWLTHFSPALPDPKKYLQNATDIFPNSIIGKDRLTKILRFEE